MGELLVILVFVALLVLTGMALGSIDGRRKHQVALRKEERLMVEARAKEREAKNRQLELEYRNAMAELERFDRRPGGFAGPTTEPVPDGGATGPAPALPERAAEPAGRTEPATPGGSLPVSGGDSSSRSTRPPPPAGSSG